MDMKSVVTKTSDAAYRVYDGMATIVLPGRAEVKVLNPAGSLVWDRIDGSHPLEEILEAIVEEFDIPRRQAEQDLLEFVTELRNHGMVS
jgi:hypothetical protein